MNPATSIPARHVSPVKARQGSRRVLVEVSTVAVMTGPSTCIVGVAEVARRGRPAAAPSLSAIPGRPQGRTVHARGELGTAPGPWSLGTARPANLRLRNLRRRNFREVQPVSTASRTTARPAPAPARAAPCRRAAPAAGPLPVRSGAATALRPLVIQGGMGVAVSSWRLASAVARTGQLGVVSGTALDTVLARRLQDGDPDGSARRALAAFPVPAIADRALARYFRDGGRPPGAPYTPSPRLALRQNRKAQELAVLRQLRRGVAGQGGPRRAGRGQLPGEGADGHAGGGVRRDARRRRRRADGRRHPARHPCAARPAGPPRGRPAPGGGPR